MVSGIRFDWDGKRPAGFVAPEGALQTEEEYRRAQGASVSNRLIHGDNLTVMASLRAELSGKVSLMYIDPPFFTGAQWHAQVDKEGRSQEVHAYADDWDGDLRVYLQWLYDQFGLARELLAENGSLYVHLNWRASHYGRLLLDELFGPEQFQNEIAWCYREAINSRKRWNRKHDTILFYTKGDSFTFNHDAVLESYSESHIRKYRQRDERGPYRIMGRGITGSPLRSHRDLPPSAEQEYPDLTFRHYLGAGTLPVDYWKIDIENQASHERTGYPTQKPEALLERIIVASSNRGDLVADFCCGSGTTPAVASRLGRSWIAVDSGELAIHCSRKRLAEANEADGFTVERFVAARDTGPYTPCAASQALTLSESVCWGEDGLGVDGHSLRLSQTILPCVDMWAIEWVTRRSASAAERPVAFRPQWWSARTRRSPRLDAISPGHGRFVSDSATLVGAMVVLWDGAGAILARGEVPLV